MQPVTLDGKETLDDISFVISAVLPLFRFKKQITQINQPIVQVPKYVFDSARQQYRSDRLLSWLEVIIISASVMQLLEGA
jgi:hypothetical protein